MASTHSDAFAILAVDGGKHLATFSSESGCFELKTVGAWSKTERALRGSRAAPLVVQADAILWALYVAARLRRARLSEFLLALRIDRRWPDGARRPPSPAWGYSPSNDGRSMGVPVESSVGPYLVLKPVAEWETQATYYARYAEESGQPLYADISSEITAALQAARQRDG